SLAQLQAAVAASNANGGGDNLRQGTTNVVVRALGLYGDGQDPTVQVLGLHDPAQAEHFLEEHDLLRGDEAGQGLDPAVAAARYLRSEEVRRVKEIRQTVIVSNNNVPVRVDQIVDGGPLLNEDGSLKGYDESQLLRRGVVVSSQTRQGKISIARPAR